MADRTFRSRVVVLLASLAGACGGSSVSTGAGGADPGVGAGGGSGSIGASGSASSGAGNVAGTSNSGAACAAISACGGDLVGTWTIQHVCLMSSMMLALSDGCAGATVNLSPVTATGTISFKADNTMASSGVISFQESANFPTSCYTEAECTAFAAALSTEDTISNADCSYDASTGCSCTLTSTQPSMSTGTYQVQGTNVNIMTVGSSKVGVDAFCVSGNTLSLYQANPNGVSASMVLTK